MSNNTNTTTITRIVISSSLTVPITLLLIVLCNLSHSFQYSTYNKPIYIRSLKWKQNNSGISPDTNRFLIQNDSIQNILTFDNRNRIVSHGRGNNNNRTQLRTNGKEIEKIKIKQKIMNAFIKAGNKFKARPQTYLMIPIIAACVGWITNWMAVQMIFYPTNFIGIPFYRVPEVPLGFIGWQGIVPCKTRKMSETMVTMVTTELLSMSEIFQRLDPRQVAKLLAPEVPKLADEIVQDMMGTSLAGVAPIPSTLASKLKNGLVSTLPISFVAGLPQKSMDILTFWNKRWLRDLTIDLQKDIHSILNVNNCVVNQMLQDRTVLGKLFWACGKTELDFLTNSGLWFGFILGIIQMIVALFWDNPWTLSVGGLIVGFATNWLALQWIFRPINPTKIGPFMLQGMFLQRQKEVSETFSAFFANRVLTSEKLWHSILNDSTTSPAFTELFQKHLSKFIALVTTSLRIKPEPEVIQSVCERALAKLPNHVHVLHPYIDETLKLKDTLCTQMNKMTSERFERVLHPIFEEDELTLILAGALLGFAAGLVQQGLETGKFSLKDIFINYPKKTFGGIRRRCSSCFNFIRNGKNGKNANDNENGNETSVIN